MKTNLFISAVITSAFFITSCEKKDHENIVSSKIMNVDLKQNESYSYQIPASDNSADAMKISQQAQHALISKITPDAARNILFEYTPATDYTGSDEVRIADMDAQYNENNNNGHNQGNCQGKNSKTGSNYIFKINITAVNVPKVK